MLDYNKNLFKLGTISNTTNTLTANGDFKGASIKLDTSKQLLGGNKKLLVGISEKLAYPTKKQDMGFFVKYMDVANFNSSDPDTPNTSGQDISVLPLAESSNIHFKINLPSYLDDMNKSSFTNKILNLNGDYFTRPLNLKIIKNFTKNFNLQLPKDGIYMLLDPGHYAEYAINLSSLVQTKNSGNDFFLEKRSGRELYNGGATPTKGPTNGWKFNKTTNTNIIWTLYDKNHDPNISTQTLIYFWISIYQPNSSIQELYLDITNATGYTETIAVQTTSQSGRYILWYSPSETNPPTNSTFDLISGTETPIQFSASTLFNISKIKLKTNPGNTNKLFLESYGYSTDLTNFNLALRSLSDSRLPDSKQLSLSLESGYNLFFSKFVNNGTSYPMTLSGTDATSALGEEITNGSAGWYFDSTKDLSLNLLSKENINAILKRPTNNPIKYNDIHTMFVEVIIKQHSNFTINTFGQQSLPINNTGQKIIFLKNSPFSAEPYVLPPQSSFATNLIIADPNIVYSGVEVGEHKYRVTYFTDVGETLSGPDDYSSTINVIAGRGHVILSSLPISNDPRVKGRNIYRTTANDSLMVYRLVTQIFDNTTLIITDSKPDYQLGKILPTTNTASAGTVEPYFSQLNPNIINSLDNFNLFTPGYVNDNDEFNNLFINAGNNTDIEIISYGYKLRGYPPIHMQTRWATAQDSPLINNIEGFLTIQKDSFSIASAQDTVVDSKFKVIAYGDFVKGNYLQNPLTNEYADIRVNIQVNKNAVQNALYVLQSSDLNNYTIQVEGLKYITRGVSIVNADGSISSNNVLLPDTKYILGDLTINNNSESTYIDTISNMKIFRRNGGLNPVLLQAVYAGMFKAFNKSGSILNPGLISSIDNLASEVIKPNVPAAQLSVMDSNNLEEGASYTYRITYYTDSGETESSLESNIVSQDITARKKILITLPISQDQRVLGRKIYRRKVNQSVVAHYYIASVANNLATTFIDDIVDPTSNIVQPPSLAYLTSNDTSYSQLTAARLMIFRRGVLTPNRTYRYKVSYFKVNDDTSISETLACDPSDPVITQPDPSQVIINLPISPHAISGRYIYRSMNGGDYGLVAIVQDNVTSIYIDNTADSAVDDSVNPETTSTLPNIANPILTSVNGTKFTYLYTKMVTYNLLTSAAYKYKFTYVVSNTVDGTQVLGETEGSDESNIIYQPQDIGSQILLNLPISINQNVIQRKIYRTTASGTVFKYLATIENNSSTIYFDNKPDSDLGDILPSINTTTLLAPIVNTTRSASGNLDPLNYLLSNSFNEVNVPAYQSTIFKLYNYSGRFAKDQTIYSSNPNANVGNSVNGIDSSGNPLSDGTQISNTVNMNLENMELNIKCKLRGALYSTSTNNALNKVPLTKEIAEFIFGKYNTGINGVVNEPDTMVREVTRVGTNTYGVDEYGIRMDMMNNDKNTNGSYKINKEIQYEIIFIIGLIQRTS
jgi:hypothetical protein